MNHIAKIIPLVLVTAIIIGAATYYTIIQTSQGTGIEATTPSNETQDTGGTTATTTAKQSASPTVPGGREYNIWGRADEIGNLRLTSLPGPPPTLAPVLVNGEFYNFSSMKMRFNLTVGDDSSNFTLTWSMGRGPYTALCRNLDSGEEVSREINDALIIRIRYEFGDGYWLSANVYLPNATWLFMFNNPPIIDLETSATPHGAQAQILGAEFDSSDPGSRGKWSSAIPLLSADESWQCEAVVEGSPEAYSLLDHLTLWMSLDIPHILQPEEGFYELYLLGEKDEISYTAHSFEGPYSKGLVKAEYKGLIEYPGTGMKMHVYNVTMTTDTGYVSAWALVAAEFLIPIEYHAYYPHGTNSNGEPVHIDIAVIEATLENT